MLINRLKGVAGESTNSRTASKIIGALAATSAIAGGLVIAQPAESAHAAPPPANVCGSNYALRRDFPITLTYRDQSGVHRQRLGGVWIYKNRASQMHCVVTTVAGYKTRYAAARIGHASSSGWSSSRVGHTISYVGPVKLSRAGGTLRILGNVAGKTVYAECNGATCWRYGGSSS